MKHRLKERFYWPGCTEAVGEWCRNCISCTTRKTVAPKRRAPLQTIKAGYPMQIVSVDLMGPLPKTEDGCKYVMVAVDCLTRWVEVYAIRNQEATTVAKKLVDEMFCRFSPPEQLHSDQGRQFESDLVKEICELLQIRKTRPRRTTHSAMEWWSGSIGLYWTCFPPQLATIKLIGSSTYVNFVWLTTLASIPPQDLLRSS